MECARETIGTLEFDKIRALLTERTVSRLGLEEIEALAPTDDIEAIQARLRPVLETMELIAFDDPLSLRRIPDVRLTLRTCTVPGSILSVPELLEIVDIVAASRRLLSYLANRRSKYPQLWEIGADLTEHADLEETFQRALDPATETVKDSASPELRRIRREMENTRSAIRRQVESVLDKLPDTVVQDRLITLRGGRFVIPIRENQRHRLEGIVHDQSASGATLFVEPMATVNLNNRLRELELAEEREVKRILRQLTEAVAREEGELRANLVILGRFDAIYAKAAFSRHLDCSEPLFNSEGRLVLRKARHPLLEYRLRKEDRANELVPLDLALGGEDFWTLVLTGPNAGGKTVALKTAGLLCLMAQAGLPVPAGPKCELPIYTGIFADIGDAQSIEDDLSTFSSHMANLVTICRSADGRSLALLDEVGASTDPDQGSALAMALLKELTERGCRTIATTHHGALKAFAHSTAGIQNGSMAFDSETLRPTFQLRQKIPGSSYAFEIARRLEMPAEIVDDAMGIAGSDVGRVESFIAELDTTYQTYREELERAEADSREAERLRADYEARLEDVEKRERELKRAAREEAQRILDGANTLVERTVREIRQQGADRQSIRQAHAGLRKAREETREALAEPEVETVGPAPRVGDRVWLRSFEKEGVVVSVREGSDRAVVEVGNVRVEVEPGDVERREAAPEAEAGPAPAQFEGRGSVSPEVDLRGYTSEEALEAVDKYLDELYLNRMERATIIHGKGTGALRSAVGEYLKHDARVKSQRLADWNEGGSGATVVELDVDAST
jgi:DNA mismatch repair protein MutS2